MKPFLKYNILLRAIALIFLVSAKTFAQDVTFTASASKTTVAAGEQFQITYAVNGSASKFQAPTFRDFDLLMGPNQSMSTQITNGGISQTISYSYVFIAQKEGTYDVPPASIEVNGKKLQSNSLRITVVKGNPPQQSQGGGSGTPAQPSATGLDSKSIFVRAAVDRSDVLLGEAITVTYKIYSRVDVVAYDIGKLPSFTGFWSEDIPLQQRLLFSERQTIDGVVYNVGTLKKVVIYPQRAGALSVDPMEMGVRVRLQVKRNRQSNDPFDMFFNNPFGNFRDVDQQLKSDPVKITVRELPKPSSACHFNGTVGKFNAEFSLDRKETKTNEAVTLKIKFSGKGNIKLIQAPVVNLPPDIETYDPKVSENINVAPGGSSGSKTFEYLLIPRKPGNFKIPLDAFCYFDLDKKNYASITPPDLSVLVERGTESGAATVSGTSKEDVKMLNKDIRFIKTAPLQDHFSGKITFLSPVFFAFQAFPFAALLLILFVRRKQIQQQSNIALMRSRKADSVARKRLKTAKKLLASNEKQKFLDEMFRALWGFVSDKLRIPVSELSRDRIREELTLKNISEEIINSFSETVDACEYARFAPVSEDDRLEDIYNKGIHVITGLDKSLK
jgi:hypothetical protein